MARKNTDIITGGSVFDLVKSITKDAEIISESLTANNDDWIPSGNYILNAAINGSLFGGIPNRRSICLAGESQTAKSYLACSFCREAQKKGYTPIVMDSEGAYDIDFVGRLGVDVNNFILMQVNTISECSNFMANLCDKVEAQKEKQKILLVLDSVGNLTSDKEKTDITEGTGKRDMTKQQELKAMFRVNGLRLSKLGIPFIIVSHIYQTQDLFSKQIVSGGSALTYNPSITLMLSKAKLEDKQSEDKAKESGADMVKVGALITARPDKSRYCKPIKIRFQIPFFKKPNPYIGLEQFITWENSGIVRGKLYKEKDFNKLKDNEKSLCKEFEYNGEKMYVLPKDTARGIVVKHLGQELPLVELFTSKVFTDELLHKLDEEVIKPTFQLPNINEIDDLKEMEEELDGTVE